MMPETFWIRNNVVFAVFAGCLLALNQLNYVGAEVLFAAFVLGSLMSSLLDLGITANSYLSESGH